MIDRADLWFVIIGLGLGSFGLRFVFLGLIGGRPIPEWVRRHLRYTVVAVLPALIAPMILWPSGTAGQFDPARLVAALVTLAVGWRTRKPLLAILAGAAALGAALALTTHLG